MSESCVFCKIARKEAPATTVFEDERVIAFMSIRPISVGHTLVVPKKHYRDIYEIPEEEIAYLYRIVKRIAHAVEKAEHAEGIRVVQNNGEAAGQVIFHLHVHIIPMNKDHSWLHKPENGNVEALEIEAKKIRQFID
jgi:histidine triad (HIT) family protein